MARVRRARAQNRLPVSRDEVGEAAMTHVEHIGRATLYLGSCEDVLPGLPKVGAVVTDPPYGLGEAAGKAATRTSGFKAKSSAASAVRDYGNENWDNEPVSAELMVLVRAAGRWNIIFGGNYYDLPPTSCWLVWDKLNGDTDFADCELAWTNLPKAVRRIRYLWNGCMRANGETRDGHPTQKPIGEVGHQPPASVCPHYPRPICRKRDDWSRGSTVRA
jgi:hypothetical protein